MEINVKRVFEEFYHDISLKLPELLIALLVMIIFIIIGKLFFSLISKRLLNRSKDTIISNFIAQSVKWLFYVFGIISALDLVGFGGVAGSLLAGAGVSAIILGFAFKDIGENFLAGIILAIKRPFEVGDIIEVDGFKGSVRDLDLRLTHLRNIDGRDMYIPNSSIIKNTLTNYTKDGNLRLSFKIGIAYESDLPKCRQLILDYLRQHSQLLKSPGPKVIVENLGEFTVDIEVLFWIDLMLNRSRPDSYLGSNLKGEIISEIKAILEKNEIEMPSQIIEHKMNRDHEIKWSNKT